MTILAWVACALLAALTGWALIFALKDRAVILRQLWFAAVIEAVLAVQLVVGIVLVSTGQPGDSFVTWLSYAIITLLMLPGAAAMAFVERTRFSSVILAIVGAVMIVMQWRIVAEWPL